jgi:hypothetical protein
MFFLSVEEVKPICNECNGWPKKSLQTITLLLQVLIGGDFWQNKKMTYQEL